MNSIVVAGCGTAVLLMLTAPIVRAQQAPGRQTRQTAQNFDADPQWDSQNNQVKVKPIAVIQDFGYSQTNHAGGQAAGEIGGRIHRSTIPAYYGRKLDKPRTMDQRLRISGRFVIAETHASSGVYFGLFNTDTMEARPRNWMGLFINGESTGCEVHAGFKTAGGHSEGIRATGTGPSINGVRQKKLIPTGIPYTFDYLYDPDANGGVGEVTFTLGGEGPLTGGPFTFKVAPPQRKSGATFNAFGMVNSQTTGDNFVICFDDLSVDGETLSFDTDPKWLGRGNHSRHDDYGIDGAHKFGYSETTFAGGSKGELGGLMFSAPGHPGYYGADIGKLGLDDRLTASGKLALREYGSDGGMYIGWFDSRKRGHPPANILGVLVDGTTSTGPRFRGCVASSDPRLGHCQYETAPLVAPDGAVHRWKIEYAPNEDNGRGRLTVWLDDQRDRFTLPDGLRQRGAVFDRFGLFVHEGGGRGSLIYLDDLEFTDASGL